MNCKYDMEHWKQKVGDLPLVAVPPQNGNQVDSDAVLSGSLYQDIYDAIALNEVWNGLRDAWHKKALLYRLSTGLNIAAFSRIPTSQLKDFYTNRLLTAFNFFQNSVLFSEHHRGKLQIKPINRFKYCTEKSGVSISCKGEVSPEEYDDQIAELLANGYVRLDPADSLSLYNKIIVKAFPYLQSEFSPDDLQAIKDSNGIFYREDGQPRYVLVTPKKRRDSFAMRLSALFEE